MKSSKASDVMKTRANQNRQKLSGNVKNDSNFIKKITSKSRKKK